MSNIELFEGFPHSNGRQGHRVGITLGGIVDSLGCAFTANPIDSVEPDETGLLKRHYQQPTCIQKTTNPDLATVTCHGTVLQNGEMILKVGNGAKEVKFPSRADVTDFAGLILWIHAKCTEMIDERARKEARKEGQ